MLTNSDIYLCSSMQGSIEACADKISLAVVPHNLQRTSPTTFMFCDNTPTHTRIIEFNITTASVKVIDELEGIYTSWDFHDDLALLLNRQGDMLLYNLLTRYTLHNPARSSLPTDSTPASISTQKLCTRVNISSQVEAQ